MSNELPDLHVSLSVDEPEQHLLLHQIQEERVQETHRELLNAVCLIELLSARVAELEHRRPWWRRLFR